MAETLKAVERCTGIAVDDAYVDKGYRGHGLKGEVRVHIAGSSNRQASRAERRRKHRRSAIEPKIGHLKSDHGLDRCFLKGLRTASGLTFRSDGRLTGDVRYFGPLLRFFAVVATTGREFWCGIMRLGAAMAMQKRSF